MKCTCCGKEITSNDRYCRYCGQNNPNYVQPKEANTLNDVQNLNSVPEQPIYQKPVYYNVTQVQKENCAIGVLSLIFGIMGGWLGLLFGIIGLCKYKESGNRAMCWIGIVIYSIWLIFYIIIFVNIR